MNGMKPLRKTFDVYRYQHSVLGLAKGSGAKSWVRLPIASPSVHPYNS